MSLDLILCLTAAWIALCLACALRIACRSSGRDTSAGGDPFFYPFGECPTVPHEAIGNYRRHLEACDFGFPSIDFAPHPSANALRRNEDGGRPLLPPSRTAAVLAFKGRRA